MSDRPDIVIQGLWVSGLGGSNLKQSSEEVNGRSVCVCACMRVRLFVCDRGSKYRDIHMQILCPTRPGTEASKWTWHDLLREQRTTPKDRRKPRELDNGRSGEQYMNNYIPEFQEIIGSHFKNTNKEKVLCMIKTYLVDKSCSRK